MRCFFAIPADIPELRSALGAWRKAEPAIRWEVPEALHLTLRFIGAWPEARVPELTAALDDLRWEPFTLELAGLGAFPDFWRAHTVWVGVAASAALMELFGAISARLAPLGIRREPRPYTPHISVAHLRRGERMGTRPTAPAARIEVGEFYLYETVANVPAGERYQVRRRFMAFQ